MGGSELTVLRVFTSPEGEHGNPLGVFLDGGAVPDEQRQAVARDLGYSETVFVDDAASGSCRIFTPEMELPFAGHPRRRNGVVAGRARVAARSAATARRRGLASRFEDGAGLDHGPARVGAALLLPPVRLAAGDRRARARSRRRSSAGPGPTRRRARSARAASSPRSGSPRTRRRARRPWRCAPSSAGRSRPARAADRSSSPGRWSAAASRSEAGWCSMSAVPTTCPAERDSRRPNRPSVQP